MITPPFLKVSEEKISLYRAFLKLFLSFFKLTPYLFDILRYDIVKATDFC